MIHGTYRGTRVIVKDPRTREHKEFRSQRFEVSLAVASLLLGSAGALAAGAATTEVTQRDVNEQQRIEQGAASGALTNRETGRLERGQARVDWRVAGAASDAKVTAGVQARIQGSEKRQSRHLRRQKHDAQSS